MTQIAFDTGKNVAENSEGLGEEKQKTRQGKRGERNDGGSRQGFSLKSFGGRRLETCPPVDWNDLYRFFLFELYGM